MSKRFSSPEHQREPDQVVWSDLPPIYWKAFGIALLLGMLTWDLGGLPGSSSRCRF